MIRTDTVVENAVGDALRTMCPCSLDDLVAQLPGHAWSDIFVAVDQMSRDGRLMLRLVPGSGYRLFLPSPQRRMTDKEVIV